METIRFDDATPIDIEDTLAFSVLENVRPMIETVPPGTCRRSV